MPSQAASEAAIPESTFVDSALEAFGGLCIAVAAAVCSGIAQARGSPIAWATLIVCAVVITPFACFAGLVMIVGLLCCIPIVAIGLVCAWLPVLTRKACELAHAATRHIVTVSEFAENNPVVLLGFGLMALPLLPVLAIGVALAGIGYLFFAPITVPATLYLLYRWKPHPEAAADEAAGVAAHGDDAATAALVGNACFIVIGFLLKQL